MVIRRAIEADAERIRFVIQTVYAEYGWPWEPDAYHRDLMAFGDHYLNDTTDFFVSEVEGLVVGCGGLVCFDPIEGEMGTLVERDGMLRIAGTDCDIVRLYLLAEYRGRGIGKGLNNAILSAAKQRKRAAVEIWSDKRLHEAHQMYQKAGAIPVGDRLCDDIEQSPEWGFYLPVSQIPN